MNNTPNIPRSYPGYGSILKRFRITFDLEVEYEMRSSKPLENELVFLRQHLIGRPELFNKLLVRKSIEDLLCKLERMVLHNQDLDYSGEDLLLAAGRDYPEELIPLLESVVVGWEYAEPVLEDAIESRIGAMKVVDVTSGEEVLLDAPPPVVLYKEGGINDYLIARTKDTVMAVANVQIAGNAVDTSIKRTILVVEGILARALEMGLELNHLHCLITADNQTLYDKAKEAVRHTFESALPNSVFSALWIKINYVSTG